jgi:hypothetical protein
MLRTSSLVGQGGLADAAFALHDTVAEELVLEVDEVLPVHGRLVRGVDDVVDDLLRVTGQHAEIVEGPAHPGGDRPIRPAPGSRNPARRLPDRATRTPAPMTSTTRHERMRAACGIGAVLYGISLQCPSGPNRQR